MWLVGSQQSRRRTMLDALFEQDEIFCLAVELIDLELVCKDGQIPFQKIDEDLLTRPEHRSEEHTSELQSLMRISYAVFCLKKKKNEYPPSLKAPTEPRK